MSYNLITTTKTNFLIITVNKKCALGYRPPKPPPPPHSCQAPPLSLQTVQAPPPPPFLGFYEFFVNPPPLKTGFFRELQKY